MSDVFREVDEEIRREQYRKLWDRFGIWIIILAVLIVVGTAGYRGWLYWRDNQSQIEGDQFLQAVELSEQGKHEEAQAIFAELAAQSDGYAVLAKMRAATDQALAGNVEAARDGFDAVRLDSSVHQEFRDIAAIRSGYLTLDLGAFDDVADRVGALTSSDSRWRFAAYEILAVADWRSGALEKARENLSKITDAADAPADVTQRARVLLEVINGSLASDPEGNAS